MNENQTFFRATIERILADTVGKAEIDRAEERQLPEPLFAALVANGITSMLLPEDTGGIGASLGDAAIILRAAGDAAAPGPLLETILGQKILACSGLEPAQGLLSLVFIDEALGLIVSPWRDAVLHQVPWSQSVEKILIVSRNENEAQLFVSDPAGWTTEPGMDAAGEPRDRLTAEAIDVTLANCGDYDSWICAASMLRAAQILGSAEWSLQRSIKYASERKQFGREIGKFQAVQQMLAELAGHILASATIVEAAAEDCHPTMVAAARSRLGDAADAAIAISHQVHGALGFSQEYALNSRTRRLMAWRDDFGSVLYWRRVLACQFTGLSREAFWPAIADVGATAPR